MLSLAVAATAALVVACGGGTTGAARSTDLAGVDDVLVDASGRPLYVAEEEAGGEIACTAGCLDIWRPLTVDAGAELSSDEQLASSLATTERDDGTRQVTFDGYPLYTFAEESSGDGLAGNGITDEFGGVSFTWRAMTASGLAPSTSPEQPDDGGRYGY